MIPPSGGTSIPPIPAGPQLARIYGLVECGKRMKKGYQGKPPELVHEIMILVEFPGVTHTFDEAEGPVPRTNFWKTRYSFDKKSNWRKFIETTRGVAFATDDEAKAYNCELLLGAVCLTVIKPSANGLYGNVDGFQVPIDVTTKKRYTLPAMFNTPILYSVSEHDDYFTGKSLERKATDGKAIKIECAGFQALPAWLDKYIRDSEEWKAIENPPAERKSEDQSGDVTEEPPFEPDAVKEPAPIPETKRKAATPVRQPPAPTPAPTKAPAKTPKPLLPPPPAPVFVVDEEASDKDFLNM